MSTQFLALKDRLLYWRHHHDAFLKLETKLISSFLKVKIFVILCRMKFKLCRVAISIEQMRKWNICILISVDLFRVNFNHSDSVVCINKGYQKHSSEKKKWLKYKASVIEQFQNDPPAFCNLNSLHSDKRNL